MLMVSALALCACQAYRPAPVDLQAQADEFAARRLDSPAVLAAVKLLLPAGGDDPRSWDRAQLLAAALAQNPQWRAARAQQALVAADELNAGKAASPDLTLQSEYARREQHPWLYGLALHWPLRAQGGLAVQQARTQTQMARLELMQSAWQIRRALLQGLAAGESARRRASLLDELGRAEDELLVIQRARVSAGEDAPSLLLPLEQERGLLEQERIDARRQSLAAQSQLAGTLGVLPDALAGVNLQWPDWGEPPAIAAEALAAARERALLSRADLDQAVKAYALSELGLRRAVASQYPHLELAPGYYWDHGIAKIPFDVSLPLPWSRLRGEIASARAARELAAARMLAVQAAILGEVDAAAVSETIARDNLGIASQRAQAAERAAESMRVRARIGDAGRDEALAAAVVSLRAQAQLLERRAELQQARLALEDAVQAPLSGPELALAADWPMTADGRGR